MPVGHSKGARQGEPGFMESGTRDKSQGGYICVRQ